MTQPKPMKHGYNAENLEDLVAMLRLYRPTVTLLVKAVQVYLREYSRHMFARVQITKGSRGPKKADQSLFTVIPPAV